MFINNLSEILSIVESDSYIDSLIFSDFVLIND